MRLRRSFRVWCSDVVRTTVRFAAKNPWRYATMLAAPPAFFVVLYKLTKFSMLQDGPESTNPVYDGFTSALLEHAPVPVFLLAGALLVGFVVQFRFAHVGSLLIPTAVLVFTGGASLIGNVVAYPPVWISFTFLELVRADILVMIGLAVLAATLFCMFRGFALFLSLVLMHGLVATFFILASFDFGYFAQTGSISDTHLVWYSIRSVNDLLQSILGELDGAKRLVLFLPLVFALLPVVVANKRNRSRMSLHRPTYAWRVKRGFLLSGLSVAAIWFAPAAPLDDEMMMLRSSSIGSLVSHMSQRAGVHVDATGQHPAAVFPDGSFALAPTDSTTGENVLVLVLESTRYWPFSIDDSLRTVTPFMDSLEANSVAVKDMSVIVPDANAALVSILCGIYPALDPALRVSVSSDCLPGLLRPHGYRSAFFSATEFDIDTKTDLISAIGFDETFGAGAYDTAGFERVGEQRFEDRVMIENGATWLADRRAQGERFFATVQTGAPHYAYALPTSFPLKRFVPDAEYNRYLNALAYQDQFLREFVSALRRSDVLGDTWVVVIGNYGEAQMEHALRHHEDVLYQEVAHVPAFVFRDGVAPRYKTVATPWQQVDVLPTIADLLHMGIIGSRVPGVSLLRDGDVRRRLYLSSSTKNEMLALRIGAAKYLYHFRDKPFEVFDLAADPGEKADLSERVSKDSLRAIEVDLLHWRRSVNARYRR